MGLIVLAVLGIFIWVARSTANGVPDAIGFAGLTILAVAGLALVLARRDPRRRDG